MPEANPQKIKDYGTYLGAEAAYNLPKVEKFAIDYGLKADILGSGNAGSSLLEPFANAINEHAKPAVEGVFHSAGWAMAELGDAVIDVADNIAGIEEDNAHLFYQFKLGEDKPGDAKGADYYGESGGTAFPIAEIDLKPPEAAEGGDQDLTKNLRGPARDVVGVADWLLEAWSQLQELFGLPKLFEGDPPTFEGLVLDPLLGDFNEITKNGNAWKSVLTDGLAAIITQMGSNFSVLVNSEFWSGPAANAAQAFLDDYWSKGVQAAAEPLGEFIASGFQKVASALSELAGRLVSAIGEVINDIVVNLVGKKFTKGGLASIVATAVEQIIDAIAEFFGMDATQDSVLDIIERIAKVVGGIFDTFRAMKEMVEAAQEYFELIVDLKGALEKIPEIGSVKDGASLVKELGEIGKELPSGEVFDKFEKGGAAYEEAEGKYREAEGKLNKAEEKYPDEGKPKREDYTPAQGPYADEADRPYYPKDGSGEVKHGRDFE